MSAENQDASRRILDAAKRGGARPPGLRSVVTLNLRLEGPAYEDLFSLLSEDAEACEVALETAGVERGTLRKMVLLKARGDPFRVERFRQMAQARVRERNRRTRG